MPDYFITGAKGAGKGVINVSKMREFILAGCVIATNIDINLAKMFPDKVKDRTFRPQVYRLPDVPLGYQILYLGQEVDQHTERLVGKPEPFIACDTLFENEFGRLMLDEFVVWMNNAERSDESRRGFLKLLPLIRKMGWSSYFQAQHVDSVDKKVRDQIESRVVVSNTARMGINVPIPIVGWILNFIIKIVIKAISMFKHDAMRSHIGHVTYKGEHVETWFFKGKPEVLDCYNTRQMFAEYSEFDKEHFNVDAVGTYMLLPPYSYYDSTLQNQPSFPLYSSKESWDLRKGVKKPPKLYGWVGRPKGWNDDLPVRPEYESFSFFWYFVSMILNSIVPITIISYISYLVFVCHHFHLQRLLS